MIKVTKAIIPAAGLGTRFLPATKSLAKEMFPILDTPTLQFIVEEAVQSGITDIMIVINGNKKAIEDHFDSAYELEQRLIKDNKEKELAMVNKATNLANIYFVRQKEANGSATAVAVTKAFVGNEPFAILFGDDMMYNPDKPVIGQLIDAYYKTGKSIVGVQEVAREEAPKYGIIKPRSCKGRFTEMEDIVEKPKLEELPSTLANLGRFVFTPDIFDLIEKVKPRSNGEYYLTDAMTMMAKSTGMFAYTFEGKRYDIGDKNGYMEATIEYALRKNDETSEKLKTYLANIVGNKFKID